MCRVFSFGFFLLSVDRASILWCSPFVCSTAFACHCTSEKRGNDDREHFWLRKLKFAFDFQLSLFPVPPLLRLLRSVLFWLSESRFLEKENRIRMRGILVLHI
jgi:hypothetical protein